VIVRVASTIISVMLIVAALTIPSLCSYIIYLSVQFEPQVYICNCYIYEIVGTNTSVAYALVGLTSKPQ
jgi:hypothetical protein